MFFRAILKELKKEKKGGKEGVSINKLHTGMLEGP